MAFIKETIDHESGAEITVLQRDDEFYQPWKIISLEMESYETLTPRELRRIGKWLIDQSKRIGKEYKPNGAPKKTLDSHSGL